MQNCFPRTVTVWKLNQIKTAICCTVIGGQASDLLLTAQSHQLLLLYALNLVQSLLLVEKWTTIKIS